MTSISDTFNQNFRVRFWQRGDPSQSVTAWLGDSPPTPSAGGGGFVATSLPMRSAVSTWQGRANLLVIDIPIMLWGNDTQTVQVPYSGGASLTGDPGPGQPTVAVSEPRTITEQAAVLIAMWRPDDDTQAPPVVKVSARNNLVPYQHLPFWVSDFTWGAAIANDGGVRIMQQLVIQLTEYRADELLQTAKVKKPARGRHQRIYRVKSGDTLSGIAKRYHLRNGWRQLAAAQHPPINDPRSLRVGQRLVIPG